MSTSDLPPTAAAYAGTGARRYGAEFLGTLLLVFFGAGSAVAARFSGGVVVVALSFGFILLALTYLLGPVSGAHVNPAVTLGALLVGTITVAAAIGYWIAQFAGGLAAGLLLWTLVRHGGVTDETGLLGSDKYGPHISLGGTFLLEIVLTFLLVLVVLAVTSRTEQVGVAAVAIGLAIAACHLVGVALDGTSVNPARALGPAVFHGGNPLSQVWVFIVAPLIGGVIAALVMRFLVRGGRPVRGPAGAATGQPSGATRAGAARLDVKPEGARRGAPVGERSGATRSTEQRRR